MTFRSRVAILVVAGAILAAAGSTARGQSAAGGIVAVAEVDLRWEDFPGRPGVRIAMIEGELKAAGPITARVKFPANYKLAPHWHAHIEHATVMSGTMYLGEGDVLDESKGKAFGPGTVVVIPAGLHHFAFTRGEVVLQQHGIGRRRAGAGVAAAGAAASRRLP